MTIQLNGAPRDLVPGTTIADAIAQLTTTSDGIAVARNGEVVRRNDWAATTLEDGDQVEVVTAHQGG
jgi:sulfur carrier protein